MLTPEVRFCQSNENTTRLHVQAGDGFETGSSSRDGDDSSGPDEAEGRRGQGRTGNTESSSEPIPQAGAGLEAGNGREVRS